MEAEENKDDESHNVTDNADSAADIRMEVEESVNSVQDSKDESAPMISGESDSCGHASSPQPSTSRQQDTIDDSVKVKERISEDIPQASGSSMLQNNEDMPQASGSSMLQNNEDMPQALGSSMLQNSEEDKPSPDPHDNEQKMEEEEFIPQPSTSGLQRTEMRIEEGEDASGDLMNVEEHNEDDSQEMEDINGEDNVDNEGNEEENDEEAEDNEGYSENEDIVDEDSNTEDKVEQTWNYESIESCQCKGKCPECPIVPSLNKKLKSENSENKQCPCGTKCCKEAIRKMYEDSIKRLMMCIQLRSLLGEEFQKFYKIFENMPMTAREFLTQYPVDNKNEIFSIHLLTQQIEIHFRSKTLVSLAASLGVQDAVEFFVEQCNADVNFTGIFRKGALTGTNLLPTEPPLFHAVHQGKLDVVKYLVQSGADVNYSSHGQSILFIASCRSVNLDIVKFLLENKARISCIPQGGIKCLQEILTTIVISEPNGLEIFELIVDNMENIDERDEMGKTSLGTAVKTQHLEAIKILIENGADINGTFRKSNFTGSEDCESESKSEKSVMRKRKYSNTSDSGEVIEEEGSKDDSNKSCSSEIKESVIDKIDSPMEQACDRQELDHSYNGEGVACTSSCDDSVKNVPDVELNENHSCQDLKENDEQQLARTSKKHIGAFEPKDLHPIVYSAYKGNKFIVNYLASLSQIARCEVANAYEVLGAERALRESATSNSGIKYWLQAAEIRKSCADGPITKQNLSEPYETLNYFAEKNTEEEIESLRGKREETLAQAVMVLERVIDYKDQETLRALASLAGGHLEAGRVMEFIKITLDIHERYMLNSIDIMSWSCKELLNHWIMLFNCQELDSITFEAMMSVCKSVEKHLRLYLEDHAYRDPILFDYIDWGESTDLMLYLLMFMESICIQLHMNREDWDELMTFIENLLRANYRDGQKKTFLHVAVLNKAFSIEGEDYYLLSNDQMAWLLIDYGADVNAIDKDGNRPLHLIYSQLATMTDEKELEHFGQFADMLVQSGAHVDVLNNKGESCVELSKLTNYPLDVVAHTSLKCLAARTIIDNKIPYKGEVPTDVEEWIQFHMKPST